MKVYPSIGKGLKIVFYAQILALVLTGYSIVSYFFPAAKAILPVALALDIVCCCGLTAGAAFCLQEDRKYLPALAFAIGSVVLSIAVPLSSHAIALVFLSILQIGLFFLSVFTLWDQTSKLLAERGDTDSARYGDKAAVASIFLCIFRYGMLGRRIDMDSFGGIQYSPFGWRLGLMLCFLVISVISACRLLRALNDAAALLTYRAEGSR